MNDDYVNEKLAEIRQDADKHHPLDLALCLYEYETGYNYLNQLYNELADKITACLIEGKPLDKDEIMADIQVGMFYRDNPSREAEAIRNEINRELDKLEEETCHKK